MPGARALGEAVSSLASGRDDLDLDISNTKITGEAVAAFIKLMSSRPSESHCNELDLSENPLGKDGLIAIIRMLESKVCPFVELELRKTGSHYEGIDLGYNPDILSFPSCSVLESIYLNDSPLGESGVQSLEAAVLADGLVNIKTLELCSTLTDDADINGALLTTLLPSIASHCPHLNDLDLSKNNLGVPGARAIGEAFLMLTNRDDLYLYLSETRINGEAAVAFSEIILTSKPSESSSNCECELTLNENQLGSDGLSAILKVLSSKSCPITTLNLDHSDLTSPESITNRSNLRSNNFPVFSLNSKQYENVIYA